MSYPEPAVEQHHCATCNAWKPLDQFYDATRGRCKTCDNARVRPQTDARKMRTKTFHMARAELVLRHPDEFQAILAEIRSRPDLEE